MKTAVFFILLIHAVLPVKIILNGLAPPEIVHSPISTKPRCKVSAPPLDLLFILDSSGSLRNQFQDEINVIRRIVKHVTIGEAATRVMLVQFSGVQHLEFDFNSFKDREDLLVALDVLRHVSGITRVGGAFEFALSVMKPEHGMRDASVRKVVFLLSDGRTHDFPKDSIAADQLRNQIPNVSIWAYGTGEYVAMNELINITKDESKIITNKNLSLIEPLFDFWHGVEVCEKIPECVKGSDKPLDLMVIIDSSDSIESVFRNQVNFVIERVVQNINVHPEAVRLALLTYSGRVFTHFLFNDLKYRDNESVIRYLSELQPIKGTTSTHAALEQALDIFTAKSQDIRPGVPKLAIVITDGRSSRSPRLISARLRAEGVNIIAVSMHQPTLVDSRELENIAGTQDLVFTPNNLHEFEATFLHFVGFGCPNLDLGPDAKPRVRGATDVVCGANFLKFTVRTQRPMNGLMYAQGFHDKQDCLLIADGKNRELSITLREGTCGLTKTVAPTRDGYWFNATVILQFHPLIVTRSDQGLDVSCFHAQPVLAKEFEQSVEKSLKDVQCTYRLHRFGLNDCSALDAKVGETLFHKWECDNSPRYQFLVHDCIARSERHTVSIVDSDGCEVDPHFLETPNYSKFNSNSSLPVVFQEMSAFKFPGDDNILFQCLVSFCDMSSEAPCIKSIPPKCRDMSSLDTSLATGLRRMKRQTVSQKPGFALTVRVETRTLNVIENEAMRPIQAVKYCDIRP
ncbi:unnamed protein product [Bursaphelenchus xylophilus]|uniref:(pine wood nematode) hypothetical protein n=1 Tax=Bursaphelenchus xylophilus TaxID=6326 RepID=A0A1I7SSV0_BURXY|nr:unnamed protein product [Bursaphelenchus xylophilus]CAG9108872.1 unnamed protein product [Bursaphelenchus xylophilus]